MLHRFYLLGALYGVDADDAFRVETGAAVNTPETLSNGELHAVLAVRMSPAAERVFIEISKSPITVALVVVDRYEAPVAVCRQQQLQALVVSVQGVGWLRRAQ